MTPEQNANKFEKDLTKDAEKVMDDVADFILSESQRNLIKNGNVDMGSLLNNITIDKSQPWTKVITYHQDYADYIEFGTEPHWIPKGVLKAWAERRLNVPEEESDRVDFLIRRKIAKEGIEAKPFVRPAIVAAEFKFSGR